MGRIGRLDPHHPPDAGAQHLRRRPDPRRALGQLGERLAAAHLERLGFTIADRNVRTRYGEIDLIAFDGVVLAVVEVKTRRARVFRPMGGAVDPSVEARMQPLAPLDGLRPSQRARLRRLAAAWLHQRSRPLYAKELRFDAVGVVVDQHDRLVRLDHVEGAW